MFGYNIKINKKKIKHAYIRINGSNKEISLSVPNYYSDKMVEELIRLRIHWIESKLGELKHRVILKDPKGVDGEKLLYFGNSIILNIKTISSGKHKVEKLGDKLIVYVYDNTKPDSIRRLILEYYRNELLLKMETYIKKWEKILNINLNEYRTKNMKTRWGTCNRTKKRIWINLRLAYIDEKYLEYVIVHEMMHILKSGHGREFKNLMSKYFPNWIKLDRELKDYLLT